MVGGKQQISLFADDVLVYLAQPAQSFPELMKSLQIYGSHSGSKLNVKEKTSQVIRESYEIEWEAESMTV